MIVAWLARWSSKFPPSKCIKAISHRIWRCNCVIKALEVKRVCWKDQKWRHWLHAPLRVGGDFGHLYVQQINCYHRYKTHDFLLKLVGIAVPLAIFFPYPIVFRKPTCECQNDRWQTSRVEIEVGQSSLPSTKWCCDVGGDWITLNLLLSHTWRVGEGVRKHSSYEGYERYQYFQILTRLEGVENHSFSDDLLLKWSSNNILKTVFHNCKYKLKQRNCSRITILDTLKNLCCTSPVRIPFQWCQGGGKTKDIRWKCQRAHAM